MKLLVLILCTFVVAALASKHPHFKSRKLQQIRPESNLKSKRDTERRWDFRNIDGSVTNIEDNRRADINYVFTTERYKDYTYPRIHRNVKRENRWNFQGVTGSVSNIADHGRSDNTPSVNTNRQPVPAARRDPYFTRSRGQVPENAYGEPQAYSNEPTSNQGQNNNGPRNSRPNNNGRPSDSGSHYTSYLRRGDAEPSSFDFSGVTGTVSNIRVHGEDITRSNRVRCSNGRPIQEGIRLNENVRCETDTGGSSFNFKNVKGNISNIYVGE